jgi:hypothetical protein
VPERWNVKSVFIETTDGPAIGWTGLLAFYLSVGGSQMGGRSHNHRTNDTGHPVMRKSRIASQPFSFLFDASLYSQTSEAINNPTIAIT